MTTDDWLDLFNQAARLTHDRQYERAATLYESVALRAQDEPTLTPKFHHLLAMRRADVAGELGQKNEAQQHYSVAMRIAFEQMQDVELVLQTVRELLLMIREWEDWGLLAVTAKQLVAFGEHHDQRIIALEASWHMPYAHRGLGEFEQARAYAQPILERMRELERAEEIQEWESFLESLPVA